MMRTARSAISIAALLAFLLAAGSAAAQAAADTVFCPAERGQFAPASTEQEPILRFAVAATNQTGFASYAQRGTGFLSISRSRVWFTPGTADGAAVFDVARSQVSRAKEWTAGGKNLGLAELQTSSAGKWFFYQIQCTAYARGETVPQGDPRGYRDILEAINDFNAAVARVKAIPRAKPAAPAMPPPAATGTLRVTSVPGGAQVYLDDRFKGSTSEEAGVLLIDNLPPAKYRVRVSSPGYKDWTAEQETQRGVIASVQATLVSAGPKALTAAEVEEALRNGVPKPRLMTLVRQYGVDFALSNEVEDRLRKAGADSDLLLVIAKAKK
jgi:hypothetical protein